MLYRNQCYTICCKTVHQHFDHKNSNFLTVDQGTELQIMSGYTLSWAFEKMKARTCIFIIYSNSKIFEIGFYFESFRICGHYGTVCMTYGNLKQHFFHGLNLNKSSNLADLVEVSFFHLNLRNLLHSSIS